MNAESTTNNPSQSLHSLPSAAELAQLKLFNEQLAEQGKEGDPLNFRDKLNQQALYPFCPTQLAAPFNANQLSTGLYWYAQGQAEALGGVGCQAKPSGEAIAGYYDPEKPIIIFVHGWQDGYVKNGLIEGTTLTTRRENFWFESGQLNVADAWLKKGWNVGLYHWTQLADDEGTFFMPYNAQAKIWTADYTQNNGTYIGMRYRTADGGYSQSNAPKQSASELFYKDYKHALQQWKGSEQGIRIMGHSLGAQMALALGSQAYADSELPENLKPARIVLADPYWSPAQPLPNHHYRYLASAATPAAHSAVIVRELQRHNVAVEWIKSSLLLNFGGDNNAALLDIASRNELVPAYLPNLALGDRHNAAPRWYMWTYQFDNATGISTAQDSDALAFEFMSLARHTQQQLGESTATPEDDRFVPLAPQP